MGFEVVCLTVGGLFLAGVLKGTTGLGYSTCGLPFLVMAIGLRPAIAVIIAPAIASNVALMMRTRHLAETVRQFAPLYLAMIPGILIGTAVLFAVDQAIAAQALGGLVVLYAIFALSRPEVQFPNGLLHRFQVSVGLANGVISGLTGSQIMPLLPYMLSLRLDSDRFVQAVNLSVTLTSVTLAIGFLLQGALTFEYVTLSVLGCLPAVAGVFVGSQVRSLLPAEYFRTVVLIVLGGLGAALLLKGGAA